MGRTDGTASSKKRLFETLERVPKKNIPEVLDFVEFLLNRQLKKKAMSRKAHLDPKKDPVLRLMGIADVEPFAKRIDQDLYGEISQQ